ncbi:MAG: hypothetical protein E4H14_14835 [Candidatus Thorarchaeota archaeon]|nr:MAG: hypothetical protein E4H14_14835 [Candidatus Thorarchaeota archaeon]
MKSTRTGRSYFIEPMGNPHIKWGSIDPATKKLMNKKGTGKYTGSIEPDESLITEENGFSNIRLLEPGTSPLAAVSFVDSQYPEKE